MKHWSSDTLAPALIVGWFSWWTWLRFLIEVGFGAWGPWITGPLLYFNPPGSPLFGSPPDMMLWITVGAVVLSLGYLISQRVSTWQGKVMTLFAYLVIVANVGYTVAVHRQEALSAESTRLYIERLETKEGGSNEFDRFRLEQAKEIYSRYEKNRGR